MTVEPPTVRVTLLQVPVALWQSASAHMEAVQREFDIVSADLGTDSVPHRLVQLVQDIDVRFGRFGESTTAELQAAALRGEDRIDLVFDVPADIAEATSALSDMMDMVDQFCREGEKLLTLAAPPEDVAFRKWLLGEFSRQIEAGLAPTAWPGLDSQSAVTGPLDQADPVPDSTHRIRFEGDLDIATAGSLRDEILSARSSEAATIVIDLSAIDFVDSVGLSLLVTAYQRMTEDGLRLQIVLPEQLRLLFDIAGLTDVLQPEFVVADRA